MLDYTQEQIERELADILPHGIREGIAKGTGIYHKIVDAYFNPNDERKSPHFTVLHILAVIDTVDPEIGQAIWQRMDAMRNASKPRTATTLSADHELSHLTKEFTDVVVAKLEGKPVHVQQRELAELRSQLNRYEDSIGRVN